MSKDQRSAQEAVVTFFAAPSNHGGAAVRHIETHLSHIFLAGETAWKLKKAVQYPFVDFRDVAARRRACLAEIEVNRAAAAMLYRAARPIFRESGGDLRIGAPDEPPEGAIDWVVEMRRFDDQRQFDRLLERGALRPADVDALADVIARLHQAAPLRPQQDWPAGLERALADIKAALAAVEGSTALAAAVAAELSNRGEWLRARRLSHSVRRCHGDLHLANIALVDGAPTPFDAIEFSEPIASVDVAYDLAFTLSDLIDKGRADFANRLLNRYLGATRDYECLRGMPLFLALRLGVRAMTAALQDPADPAAARRVSLARGVLARGVLAGGVSAGAAAPTLTAVGGLSGAGKSTLAAALAAEPLFGPVGAIRLNSDVARKRLYGVKPEEPLPPEAYQGAVSERIYAQLRADAAQTLAAGASVIIDAVHARASEREAVAALAAEAGAPFVGLWIDAPMELRAARADTRRDDPSDADASLATAQDGWDVGEMRWTRLDGAQPLARLIEDAAALYG